MFAALRDPGWLAGHLDSMPEALVLHAREKLATSLMKGHFKLLTALGSHAAAKGWGTEVVAFTSEGQDTAIACPRHLHIFMDDRPVYAPNAFHCVPSYLHGYWYFDEIGSRNNAQTRLARFDPRPMQTEFAQKFHAGLVARFVDANRSKFAQAPRGEALVPGCLAFFAQDFKPPRHHRHYLSVPQMIEAAIAVRRGRVLYIKPHPNNTLDEIEHLARYHDPAAGVVVTQASIHDLLASCACALTVTSAVGFEAFLHKKPVVLGGQTDFWQNAVTVTDVARMPEALDLAMGRHWPYEKFLVWFLRQQCHEDTPAALPGVLAKIARKGFGWAGSGMFAPD